MISAIVAQAAKFAASRGGAAGGDQQVGQPAAAACASPALGAVTCSQPLPCKQTGCEGSQAAGRGAGTHACRFLSAMFLRRQGNIFSRMQQTSACSLQSMKCACMLRP